MASTRRPGGETPSWPAPTPQPQRKAGCSWTSPSQRGPRSAACCGRWTTCFDMPRPCTAGEWLWSGKGEKATGLRCHVTTVTSYSSIYPRVYILATISIYLHKPIAAFAYGGQWQASGISHWEFEPLGLPHILFWVFLIFFLHMIRETNACSVFPLRETNQLAVSVGLSWSFLKDPLMAWLIDS